MYAVVGCNECAMLWLLSDPDANDTATCPRCGKTHQRTRLKHFFESENRSAARQARSALLAKKHGDSEAFADVAHVSDLEAQLETAGVSDREYLEGSGLDAEDVFAAGERAGPGNQSGGRGGRRPRIEIVREAIETVEEPTEEAIVSYAREDGVPAEATRDLLERLRQRGDVSESRGTYRLV